MKVKWQAAAFLLILLSAQANAANHTVNANSNLTFSPKFLTIAVGDTVTFRNNGGVHNVASDDDAPMQFRCANGCDGAGGNGNPSAAAWSATVTFSIPGQIGYYCELHGGSGLQGMAGRITVTGVAPAVPGAPTGVTASAGNAQATVSFSAPASDGGSAITGYSVVSNPAGGTDSQAGSTSLSHLLTGLGNGTAYTFTVTASNAVGTGPASSPSNSVTPTAPTPSLSISDTSLAEGNGGARSAVLPLSLSSAALPGGVSVDVTLARLQSIGNAAQAGQDYATRETTRLTIPAGQTGTSYAVKILGDRRVEPDEMLLVKLSNVSGATLAKATAIVTIVNDDSNSLAAVAVDACGSAEREPEQVRSASAMISLALEPADPAAIAIAVVQGRGQNSLWAGRELVTRGVVTALRREGFFMQAPDDERDADPETSEGLFVFTGGHQGLAVGDHVQVRGRVDEVRIGTRSPPQTLTQLIAGRVGLLARQKPLPEPVLLAPAPDHTSPPWWERFEGMRVSAPRLTVVGPVAGRICESQARVQLDGVFYAVLDDSAQQPMRGKDAPNRLRVDSAGQVDSTAWAVDAGDRIEGAVGVLGYGFGLYRLITDPDQPVNIRAGVVAHAVDVPRASEITVGQVNLRRLFNDQDDLAIGEPVLTSQAYALRLAKTANSVCAYLRNPDLLAMAGFEGRSAAVDLAAAINSQAGNLLFPGRCEDDPKYRVLSLSGSDAEGLDLGFLISTAEVRAGVPRVQPLALSQEGRSARLLHPDGSTEALYAQPPLLLHARVNGPGGAGEELTLIAVQLVPATGAAAATPGDHGWPSQEAYLRAKRRAQALHLGALIQARQSAEPDERLIVLGGFEANESGDGHEDLMGMIAGRVDGSDGQARTAVHSRPQPLSNLSLITSDDERYSVNREGLPQAVDHILVNRALLDRRYRLRIEHARIDADFGEHHAGDFTSQTRISEHDPIVLYIDPPSPDPGR